MAVNNERRGPRTRASLRWLAGWAPRAAELGPFPVIVVLLGVWAYFQFQNVDFLSGNNLTNLAVDTAGLGFITIGVVFVFLVGDIDLSVANISALAAVVFVVLNVDHAYPEWLALVIGLLVGVAVGYFQGSLVARLGVPAVAVTLAGLLGWTGVKNYILLPAVSVSIDDQGLVAKLTSEFLPGYTAWALAATGVGAYAIASWREARRRAAARLPHRPAREIVFRSVALAIPVFAAASELASFRGLPLAFLIFVIAVGGLDLVLRRTTYGRKVFALGGGGQEAARRAGINVVAVRTSVFVMSGLLAAIGGMFLASRITSVSVSSGGGGLLINVIAAAVIGGTSLYGGRGAMWLALLGALIIQSIASGMALLGIALAVQFMVTGGVLLVAVVLDALARRYRQAHARA